MKKNESITLIGFLFFLCTRRFGCEVEGDEFGFGVGACLAIVKWVHALNGLRFRVDFGVEFDDGQTEGAVGVDELENFFDSFFTRAH